MRILVIDGQSGRLGAQLISAMREAGIAEPHSVVAVGANALATAAMLKAGADAAATGENAVLVQCRKADLITGPIGILMADSLLGEISPAMAAAVGGSEAVKIPVPVNRCRCVIPGLGEQTRAALVEAAAAEIARRCSGAEPEAAPKK